MLFYAVLCCILLCCVVLRCVALRCVALRCVALRCVVLRCGALGGCAGVACVSCDVHHMQMIVDLVSISRGVRELLGSQGKCRVLVQAGLINKLLTIKSMKPTPLYHHITSHHITSPTPPTSHQTQQNQPKKKEKRKVRKKNITEAIKRRNLILDRRCC